ncbi:MAG: hypothetical protein DI543_04805 [Bradyrhizobium icense]|jgi:hypothetical protein|nr:MAG: hypothetical protein DI543_04805 [Bradyrhizobium icense]
MNRLLLITALLAGFLAGPAIAQIKGVPGWLIQKRENDKYCNASRDYRDAADENRDYGFVLTYSPDRIVMVLFYEGWEWEKAGDILSVDLSTENGDIMKKSRWEVLDKTGIRGVFDFDQKILDGFSGAERLFVDAGDDEDDSIEVKIPQASRMLAALKSCQENGK